MTEIERKKYAAVCYALGYARSAMGNLLLNWDSDKASLQKAHDATATVNIAKAVGMNEANLASEDMFECLSTDEKWKLKGNQ